MHFHSQSALLASCIAISVHALPVTYSVVDVDGGSSAANAANQPETVYHTVTKSTEVEKPEPTTVSVSVTIVKTDQASSSPTSSSTSSSTSLQASAQASSTAPAPSVTALSTSNVLSVLESARSTFLTSHTSTNSASSALPVITSAPSAASSSAESQTASDCDCDDWESTVILTVTPAIGGTVTLFSTTTVTPAAESTSYYDDGMWHTRYAIKPAASPQAEQPPSTNDDAVSKFDKSPALMEEKQTQDGANTPSQAVNGTSHARRDPNDLTAATTPSGVAPATPSEDSGAPLMLVQPLLPQATGTTTPAAPVHDAAASEVLTGDAETTAGQTAKRAPAYSVVSWNETTQG